MTLNRAQRRQATREFQAQLASGKLDLSQGVDLAEEAKKPKRIFLGYITAGTVTAAWHRSILHVAAQSQQFGYLVRPRDCEATPERLARARNLLLKNFLETEDEYLLFTDTNIAFAPQDVAMLLATDAAIAGALYFSAALGQDAQPQAWVEDDDGAYAPVVLPTAPEDFNEEDQEQLETWLATLSLPIPVAGVGFGLCLIKRDVAAELAESYAYPFEAIEDRDADLTFCLRAGEYGHQAVVMPAARVGNMQLGMQ